jgi:hypothetical protein
MTGSSGSAVRLLDRPKMLADQSFLRDAHPFGLSTGLTGV